MDAILVFILSTKSPEAMDRAKEVWIPHIPIP